MKSSKSATCSIMGGGHGCTHSRQGQGGGVWLGIDLFGMVLGHFAGDALDRRLNRIYAQRGQFAGSVQWPLVLPTRPRHRP